MGIQSTVEITREEAIDKAIKRFAEKHRKKFELMFDSELEEYIKILGHIPHLEDLFRVAKGKSFGVICYIDGLEIYMGEGEEESMKSIDYNPTLPLLDQPNLSDIISLIK